MPNFEEAYNITMGCEGGYANNPLDNGGETYKGISRKYNSSWEGWAIIDKYKSSPSFPKNAYADKNLDAMVKSFYKENYWDANLLNEFKSQIIANEMFDTSVNIGMRTANMLLQKALNSLNKNGSIYQDISKDGKIGANTIKALNTCISVNGEDLLYKVLNILQGSHYLDIASNNPTQENFMVSWFNRVTFSKK